MSPAARIAAPRKPLVPLTPIDATADLASPRPALMDRLHFTRADAAEMQQTLGNQVVQRIAHEQKLGGDAPLDGSAPKVEAATNTQANVLQPHADEPTAPPLVAPASTAVPPVAGAHATSPTVRPPAPRPGMGIRGDVKLPAPGPASTISDLQSQVARAAEAIPKPAGGGYTEAQQAIRAQGFRLARAYGDSAPAKQTGGGGARPEESTRPYEPDPVPKETKALLAVGRKKLDDVIPPPFEETRLHHIPRLGARPLSGDDLHVLNLAPNDARRKHLEVEREKRIAERNAHRVQVAAGVKDPRKKARILNAKPGADEPQTFEELDALLRAPPEPSENKDEAKKKAKKIDPRYEERPPPGPVVLPAARKEQLAKVLAGLKAEPDATVNSILELIRPNVESDNVRLGPKVQELMSDLGEPQKERVKSAFLAKVDELQKGAGITDAELEQRVDERKKELNQLREDAFAIADDAARDDKREVLEKASENDAATAARAAAVQTKSRLVKQAVPHAKLAMDVDGRRKRLLGYVSQDVAEMIVRFKQKGEIRDATIARMAADYIDAYRFAAQQDTYAITTAARTPTTGKVPTPAESGRQQNATEEWLKRVIACVDQFKIQHKQTDDANVARLQAEVRTAGAAKSEAIRSWAEKTSGKKRSEEEKAGDKLVDIAEQMRAEWTAIADLSRARLAQGVADDFNIVDRIADDVKQGFGRETIIAHLQLNRVEVAILEAYLKAPDRGDNRALSGVMAGIRMRLQLELQPELSPLMEKEILGLHRVDDASRLNKLGGVQTTRFDAVKRANQAYDALDKYNTDEEAVYEALDNLTKIQSLAVQLAYISEHGHPIEKDLKGGYIKGMSGNELKRAQKLLAADHGVAAAIGYRLALKGNNEGAWYGGNVPLGDSEALDKINHGKSPEERRAAEDAYNAEYDLVLKAQLARAADDGQRRAILDKYRADGKSQLRDDANASLKTQRQKEKFASSMAGDDEAADTDELRDILPTPEAIRSAESASYAGAAYFVVADRKKLEAVYDRITREATEKGDRNDWTTPQIQAEIARRTEKIEANFQAKYGKDYEGSGKSALRAAFDIGFRHHDDEKNLANALADNKIGDADAAKVHIEDRGVYASDDVLNGVLQSQYERKLADIRRDEMPLRRMLMARELVDLEKKTRADARAAALKGNPEPSREQLRLADQAAKNAWTGAIEWHERERLQREIDRQLEDAAGAQAKGNMDTVRVAFRRDYDEDFDAVIKSDTSGYSGDKAARLLEQNGRLTLGQTMFYAVRGPGTDKDALNTLKGHTAKEIAVARADFKELAEAEAGTPRGILNRIWDDPDSDPTNMDTEVKDDISGRTLFDVSQMLKGEPETIEEKETRLIEAVDWEKKAGPLGHYLGEEQETALQRDLKELKNTIAKLKDPNLTAEQRAMYLDFFDTDVATVNAGIAAHRAELDSWTDSITTVVGLVVGLAVTAITFGAAGPVLAAVLGSIMATAATMSTKALILGAAYGWEDIATDLVIGIVDAAAAALTAGMGAKWLGTAVAKAPNASSLAIGKFVQRSLGAGGRLAFINPAESALARMIPTNAALQAMMQKGGGLAKLFELAVHEAESIVAATPSALAASILDENNYQEGNPVGNILRGTVKQVGTSVGMSLAMKAGMHPVKTALEFTRNQFKATRTPEASWLRNYRLAQQEIPGISHADFTKLQKAARLETRMRQRAASERPPSREQTRPESARAAAHETTTGGQSRERRAMPHEHLAGEEVGARPSAEMGAPGPNDPNVIKGDAFTTPREMTKGDVGDLVPTSLRDKIEVIIDPEAPRGEVRVERVMRLGVIVDLKLVVGPHVRPIDIVYHGQTIHAMQRYLGVSGRLLHALDRLRSFIAREGLPPFGTRAWEAWHELNKLPAIVEQRFEMLRTGALDPHAEALIHADIDRLSRQIDEHHATLDRMDTAPGVGYIAMAGDAAAKVEANAKMEAPPQPLPPGMHQDRWIPFAERTHENYQRHPASHSALEHTGWLRQEHPNATFHSVGEPWVERRPEGERVFRTLEVRDGKRVVLHLDEIQAIDAHGNLVDHWLPRNTPGRVTSAAAIAPIPAAQAPRAPAQPGGQRAKAASAKRGPAPDREDLRRRINDLQRRVDESGRYGPDVNDHLNELKAKVKNDPHRVSEVLEDLEAELRRPAAEVSSDEVAQLFHEAQQHASDRERAFAFEPGERGEVPTAALVESETPNQRSVESRRASSELAAAMAAADDPRPAGHETHHIVADRDPRAARARRILEAADISVRNDPRNGVHLPRTSMDPRTRAEAYTRHQTIHTNAYYNKLTRRLVRAQKRGPHAVEAALAKIKKEIYEGTFMKPRTKG